MDIYFRDLNKDVIDALKHVFVDKAKYEVGSIFSSPVEALVSPANSFGWMDGGIDARYVDRFGYLIEQRVQHEIAKQPFAELLVGQSIVVPTGDDDFPYLIAAPTMRVPRPTTAENVFLAARSAFSLALKLEYKSIACPGLGTLSGRVSPKEAAEAMHAGYKMALRKHLKRPISHASYLEGRSAA